MKIKEVLFTFFKHGYLPSNEILKVVLKEELDISEVEKILSLSKKLEIDGNLAVVDYISYKLLKNQEKNVNWRDFEKFKVFIEKNKGSSPLKTVLSFFMNEEEIEKYFEAFINKRIKNKENKFANFSFEILSNNSSEIKEIETSEVNKEKMENVLETKKNNEEEVKKDEEITTKEKSEKLKNKKTYDLKSFFKQKDDVLVGDYKNYGDLEENNNLFDNLDNKEENLEESKNKEKEEKKKKEEENEERGIMNKEFLEEIKKKVESIVNVNYSPNKIEWVENDFKIVRSFKANPKKVEVVDFLKYFRSKYKKISEFLLNRLNGLSKDLVSIDNLKNNETYTVIAMVRDVEQRGDFLVGILEDLSGEIRFKVNMKEVKNSIELVPDDVAAFVGKKKGKFFYVEKIIYPDIPNNTVKWLKDYGINEDIYVLILSDIHVGSKLFLKKKFEKFIEWLNGKNNKYHGKIGYLIINGDVVDGIGVYPEQIEELEIGSGYDQYATFAKFLELIPSEINVFVAPGNHDIVRQAEPQPILPNDIAEPLKELNNVTLISNPSLLLFKDYVKVLNYHGYSYDYFINEVEHLRSVLSYEKIHELMSILMKKRHLVPSYKSAPIAPEHEDYLVIDTIPNMLVSGHIHYSSVGDYKGVKLLSSSCWQDITPFQEKVGHNPDPGKIPLINLKDGSIKILQF